MISRRTFIGTGLGLSSLPFWSLAMGAKPPQQVFASAFSLNDNTHFFALFDESGKVHWQQALSDRAHAPILHPNKTLVAITARRPGYYLDLFNLSSGEKVQSIKPTTGFHFYGHGIFSQDGQHIITSENQFSTGKGYIFIRDLASGNIVNSFPSHGIGPHEIALLDENTLVVANGGLQTHPDSGRKILNLDSMQANLSFLSLPTGELLHQIGLPDEYKQSSIRHFDINSSGEIAIGCQYQGDRWDEVPLIATANIHSQAFNFLPLPQMARQRLKQYCGSVTFDQSGQTLAVSSPRGDLIVYWDMTQDSFLGIHNFQDVCGIAATNKDHQFLITTGKGKRVYVNPITRETDALASMKSWHWDNHISQLAL